MTKRELQKKETREKLLIAASACFAEKGYSACSVSDIVARAGMSQGSLYVHFSGKEALFKSMIEEEHRQGAEKARLASCSAPFLNGVISLMTDCIIDVGFPIDHRLWTEILAVAARDDSMRTAFISSDREMRIVFSRLLEKAAESGEIDGSLDFDAVSIWLYALVDGLIARVAADGNFDIRKHLDLFELLVRRALQPQIQQAKTEE